MCIKVKGMGLKRGVKLALLVLVRWSSTRTPRKLQMMERRSYARCKDEQ